MRIIPVLLVLVASTLALPFGEVNHVVRVIAEPSALPASHTEFREEVLRALNPNTTELVYGGSPAPPGAFPQQVFISYRANDGKSYICGGSLLSTTHVLTAAHCTVDMVSAKIMAGGVDITSRSGNTQWRNANRIVSHGQYDPARYYNDIAVIEFSPALVENRDIQLTKIVEDDAELVKKTAALVTGYGVYHWQAQDDGISSDELLYSTVSLFPFKYCNTVWYRRLRDSQVCAGAKDKGAGPGDSGGPLLVSHNKQLYQVGLTSYGTNDQDDDEHHQDRWPTIFTRVSSFCDFIDRATDGTAKCGRIDDNGPTPASTTAPCTPKPRRSG
ncbi:hypothetical protein QR680_013602 [Steinernema hermaphroditum]|uniref:Acrosin n=1 Tax=Steinernema hermaphroditum TaxID=289476 RepID=A0AA39I629_9BILA|nr:hypothetical protein QR680_013602 [Steinernema hermaphroditum]